MKFLLTNNKLEKTWEFKNIDSLRTALDNIHKNIENKMFKAILSIRPHVSRDLIEKHSSIYAHYNAHLDELSEGAIKEVEDNYVYSTHLLEVFIYKSGQVDIESCSLTDFDDDDFGNEDFEGNVKISTVNSVDPDLSKSERDAMIIELESQLIATKSYLGDEIIYSYSFDKTLSPSKDRDASFSVNG